MKSHLQSVVLSTLLVLALSMSSSAMAQGFTPISFAEIPSVSIYISEESEPLANLFLQLMTRPGVTDSSDILALHSAAQGAALSFRRSMFHGPGSIVKLARFRKDAGLLLQTYQKEYGLAPEGFAGAETKGQPSTACSTASFRLRSGTGYPLKSLTRRCSGGQQRLRL